MPAWDCEPEFLFQLTFGAGVVVFASPEVSGSAGVIAARERVLRGGALLDEKSAARVEHEDVNCPVAQPSGVDLPARGLTDNTIRGVNQVEEFVGALCQMRLELDVDFGSNFVGDRRSENRLGVRAAGNEHAVDQLQ